MVVGWAQPSAIQAAAAAQAEAYKSDNAFFWEFGNLEGLPEENSDT